MSSSVIGVAPAVFINLNLRGYGTHASIYGGMMLVMPIVKFMRNARRYAGNLSAERGNESYAKVSCISTVDNSVHVVGCGIQFDESGEARRIRS